MASKSMCGGSISFGLVNIPKDMKDMKNNYIAIDKKDLEISNSKQQKLLM